MLVKHVTSWPERPSRGPEEGSACSGLIGPGLRQRPLVAAATNAGDATATDQDHVEGQNSGRGVTWGVRCVGQETGSSQEARARFRTWTWTRFRT